MQGGLIFAAGRVRSNKKKKSGKKHEKFRRTQSTPRNPQQPGDRDQLETAGEATRPTRYLISARFHRFRVCGNGPLTAFAISKNHECYTYTLTDRPTDRQTDRQIKIKKRPRSLRSLGLVTLQ